MANSEDPDQTAPLSVRKFRIITVLSIPSYPLLYLYGVQNGGMGEQIWTTTKKHLVLKTKGGSVRNMDSHQIYVIFSKSVVKFDQRAAEWIAQDFLPPPPPPPPP